MKDEDFVRLTGKILKMEGLTSTDKIVLGYNLTLPIFFASNAHVAASVGMKLKTVEKSITKLRKLGLWREPNPYSERKRKSSAPTRGGAASSPSYSGRTLGPTRVGKDSAISPLKTAFREERGEESLFKKKKGAGEESAAGAPPLCDQPQTFLKNLGEEDSAHKITQKDFPEKSGSGGSVREADTLNNSPRLPPTAPPLGSNGKHLSDVEMVAENLKAWLDSKPDPFTKEQVAEATQWATCAR